ncbi:hypothetical protein KAI04_04640 [Candidatus Pacearchaeota archaeon]|nr:hypothetical protein [Candidatus Pacearchaeota archaeon]
MSQQITVYYKSEKPAETKDIVKACGIFTKNKLLKPEIKDILYHEQNLRKIVYSFSNDQHMPVGADLDDMLLGIINSMENTSIRMIESINKNYKKYQRTPKDRRDKL